MRYTISYMKSLVYTGLTLGSLIGSWLGSLIDHSFLGLWSILLGIVGSFLGIWAGYKAGQYF